MKSALFTTLLGAIFTSAMLTACGAPQPATTPEETTPTEPAVTDEPVAMVEPEQAAATFDEKSFDEKKLYMKETVVPSMGELFLAHHPDFGCATCHGKTMADVQFKMPNTLDPLDPQNMPFNSTDEKVKSTAQFMKEKVVPKMAGLVDEQPYDPATKEGLGCFDCHATKTP